MHYSHANRKAKKVNPQTRIRAKYGTMQFATHILHTTQPHKNLAIKYEQSRVITITTNLTSEGRKWGVFGRKEEASGNKIETPKNSQMKTAQIIQ